MTDRYVPLTKMTDKGRAMLKDNFFHAIAMELHLTGFYLLTLNFLNPLLMPGVKL